MRFALVDDIKAEPEPKLRGSCQFCSGNMISKCGRVKQWHWAHKSRSSCDPWWETETDWHRNWKSQFPDDWQEVIHFDDKTGEKHIADVKTPHGLVIELQHSPISPEELHSREAFYREMIWIVDGNRGPLDASYFNMGLSHDPIQDDPLAFQVAWWGRSRLLHNWSEATAKVFLDFGTDMLWRLVLFEPEKRVAAVGPMRRDWLIQSCIAGDPIGTMALDTNKLGA